VNARVRLEESNFCLVVSGHISQLEVQEVALLILLLQTKLHLPHHLLQIKQLLVLVLQFLIGLQIFIFLFKNHALTLFLELGYLLGSYLWARAHLWTQLMQP
jgi:hypothetical protein